MSAWDWISNALLSLVPPTLVGIVFWVIMRSIIRADSKEREVYAQMEAEMRAEREAQKPNDK
jgi:flagellar biosynthesis/type III secretory pathway M-ring protein FliF/YscJ